MVIASLALLAGCGGSGEGDASSAGPAAAAPKAEVTPAVRQEAQQMFNTRCAVCHGQDGRGDGPAAVGLSPAPRNYHDPAWQASVTDEQIEQTIVYGGAAVGKSPAMVANPDLGNRPALVAALREIIRGFGKEQ
jgi:mono/diheme cytochrome c family protein